jgi:hypothetical protein
MSLTKLVRSLRQARYTPPPPPLYAMVWADFWGHRRQSAWSLIRPETRRYAWPCYVIVLRRR